MNSRFFCSDAWFSILQNAFSCKSVIINTTNNLSISIFSFGPIRLAYTNFPVGLTAPLSLEDLNTIKKYNIDILRCSYPESLDDKINTKGKSILLPETIIHHLDTWSFEKLRKSMRYKIKKSIRAGVVSRGALAEDGVTLFNLYKATVKHHRGAIKYTKSYFNQLCLQSTVNPNIIIIISEYQGQACAFVAGIINNNEATYLHGGTDRNFSFYRPGYNAMYHFLTRLNELDVINCNMLTSPKEQVELVNYKESWGGVTHLKHHKDIPLSFMANIYLFLITVINKCR